MAAEHARSLQVEVLEPIERREMFRLAYSLLVALALMLSPLGMMGGGMAMAHGGSAMEQTEGHCPDSDAPAEGSQAMLDCTGICSALAGTPQVALAERLEGLAPAAPRKLRSPKGLQPESEPPPPRFS